MILWGFFEENEDKDGEYHDDGVDYPLRVLELFIAVFGVIEWLYWFTACRKC